MLEWWLVFQIMLLMIMFYIVVAAIISRYYESVAACELIVAKGLQDVDDPDVQQVIAGNKSIDQVRKERGYNPYGGNYS